ncbi:hypothetical protein HY417_00630 [Candidatus Kaiserbacteria bacterium]|nr:hypothetical protein [Candidatus Kaiserbacteria bacterium]
MKSDEFKKEFSSRAAREAIREEISHPHVYNRASFERNIHAMPTSSLQKLRGFLDELQSGRLSYKEASPKPFEEDDPGLRELFAYTGVSALIGYLLGKDPAQWAAMGSTAWLASKTSSIARNRETISKASEVVAIIDAELQKRERSSEV